MSNSKPVVPLGGDRKGTTYKDLVIHFFGTAASTNKGKLLLIIWATGSAATWLYGIWKRFNDPAKKFLSDHQSKKKDQPARKKGLWNQLQPLLKIAFPTLFSSSTLFLGSYTALLILRIMLTIKIATVSGKLGKLIGGGHFTEMFHNQVIFSLWCYPAAIVNSLLSFCGNELSLSMRTILTKWFHKQYLFDSIYYRSQNVSRNKIDDIDHRLSQDLKKFCSSVSELYGNLLKPILEVFLYTFSLSRMMGFRHLAGFYVYFLISSQWLQFVMPPFSRFTSESQRLEGEFRAHHRRVLVHSEEIAFFNGDQREREILDASYSRTSRISKGQHFFQLFMGILDNYLVKYGASMVAYSMLIPAVYFGLHGLGGKSTEDVIQYYLTSTQLFVALGNACKNLVLSYKRIESLTGYTERISEVLVMLGEQLSRKDEKKMIEEAWKHPQRTGGAPQIITGDVIEFKGADIFSPAGQLLIRNLSLVIERKKNVLVSGRNGAGKTSLFRVLAGLWPLCTGTLVKPQNQKLFYVPQKPYMTLGTLRDQITYPEHMKAPTQEQDDHLYKLLEMVQLEHIVKREGWNTVKDWADVLSGGEKQRIGMARLFYHKPEFGILDETTSAVSMDVEGKIYQTCHELGITIFTVSHRPQLKHHHDYVLHLDGEGGWTFTPVDHDDQPSKQETH